jgi:hypothetical protein
LLGILEQPLPLASGKSNELEPRRRRGSQKKLFVKARARAEPRAWRCSMPAQLRAI